MLRNGRLPEPKLIGESSIQEKTSMKKEFKSMVEWRATSLSQWQAFRKEFPIERIQKLKLDEYVIGTKTNDTFCWWLERGTEAFASISGSYASMFGIYKSGDDYLIATHLKGMDENAALRLIKEFAVQAADAASRRDIEELCRLVGSKARRRGVWPLVVWKMALLYQPIDAPFVAPICASSHAALLEAKNVAELQRTFCSQEAGGDYWSRGWDLLERVRRQKASDKAKSGSMEVISDDECEAVEPWCYGHLLDVLREKKNLILQGAPGTGKTYLIPELVVRLCNSLSGEVRREEVVSAYQRLKREGRVVAMTFHPSLDYDDFVQGWKPDPTSDGSGGMKLKLVDGVFKRFCDLARKRLRWVDGLALRDKPAVWLVALHDASGVKVQRNCLEQGRICIERTGKRVENKAERVQAGDVVLLQLEQTGTCAVGIITADCRRPQGVSEGIEKFCSFSVTWLFSRQEIDLQRICGKDQLSQSALWRVPKAAASEILKLLESSSTGPFIFVIDEFNRGNVPKIFGELLTLIEADKRVGQANASAVHLAYEAADAPEFSIPPNVYIIGTMNTADRSIAPIDYALRRRFAFGRLLPHEIVSGQFNQELFRAVSELFVVAAESDSKNERLKPSKHLSEEFNPADVWIGHSYFLHERDRQKTHWCHEIRPLLMEYLRDGVLKRSAEQVIEEIEANINQEES